MINCIRTKGKAYRFIIKILCELDKLCWFSPFVKWAVVANTKCVNKTEGPQFSSVQSRSHIRLFVTSWTTACQASLSITNSQSLLKLMSIESVMPSNHLILCHLLLLLPSILPSIGLFSFFFRGVFKWVSSSYQEAKVLEPQFQHQSFQWIFRTDFL